MIITIVSMLVALILSLLFNVVYIDFLKKKLYGQTVRDVGPQSHLKKNGTPTTGGVVIIISIIISSLIALPMEKATSPQSMIIILTLIFYALTGFKDDMQKIKKHENKGLSALGKLFLQIVIAFLPAFFICINGNTSISFLHYSIDLGWFYPLFAIFVIAGSSNAVNLTDGIDGLASLNCALVFGACSILSLLMHHSDIAIIAAAVAGACLGFLYFNRNPAQVFMGDTGSLALGGLLGTIAVIGKFELYLIFIGIIFIIETLSVMLQVASFKLTGKRIFKMSPIHHHFELSGWSENKIVIVFSAVTFIFSALAIILYYL